MSTFSLNQLVTIIQALRVYEAQLKSKLELLSDDDEYSITADEIAFVKDFLPQVEVMHEQLYAKKFGGN